MTIIITGTSSGIGRAAVKKFSEMGWRVFATLRDPSKETEMLKWPGVSLLQMDLLQPTLFPEQIKSVIEQAGHVDVLLNNAGFGAFGPLECTSLDIIRKQFDVNVIGLLALTKTLIPHFRKNGSGMIVNVSSVAGTVTGPLGALYHGSKFAVEGLSESLYQELAALGIQVKLIVPGVTKTDFMGRSLVFSNDPGLSDYQKVITNLTAGHSKLGAKAADACQVADGIYAAVTDGTSQLRYYFGSETEDLIQEKRTKSEVQYLQALKDLFS